MTNDMFLNQLNNVKPLRGFGSGWIHFSIDMFSLREKHSLDEWSEYSMHTLPVRAFISIESMQETFPTGKTFVG